MKGFLTEVKDLFIIIFNEEVIREFKGRKFIMK